MTERAEQSQGAPHPEEMRASVTLRLGGDRVLEAEARTTPAGIVAVGVAVAAILASTAVLVRAARPGVRWLRF